MESIILNTSELPSGGEYYQFKEIKIGVRFFFSPEIAPSEPITKPDIKPKPIIKPDENPWVWPFPSVEPTPKGFF